MEFVDQAYKVGAGRYLQQPGALGLLGSEVAKLGRKCLVLGGPTAISLAGDATLASLGDAGVACVVRECPGYPTYEAARDLADDVALNGCEVVVGVGGGRAMDLAKAVASTAQTPVIEVPTSVATCAAYTPLSVMYTSEGAAIGCWRFVREVDAVIVDEDLLPTQPGRLVAAGMLDAMAKTYEIANGAPTYPADSDDLPRACAYAYACANNRMLERYGRAAFEDAEASRPSEDLSKVAFVNILLTGVVSALTRGFHQTALAHKLYDGIRTHYTLECAKWLHGELVAIGLLMQSSYNNDCDGTRYLRSAMVEMGMPTSLADVGIQPGSEQFERLREHVRHPDFVPNTAEAQERFERAFGSIVS